MFLKIAVILQAETVLTCMYVDCMCVLSMGYIGPVCVVLFFVVSTVINKFLMSPVVDLVFQQEQLEGDFR